MDKTLYIYFDDVSCPQPLLVGQLSAQNLRGKEVFAFEFSDLWLKQRTGRPLDPDLQLYGGRQFLQTGKSNFGIFLDSSLDRWGRVLLDRREAKRQDAATLNWRNGSAAIVAMSRKTLPKCGAESFSI